jgi:polyhydroxybutyrate depolymerase
VVIALHGGGGSSAQFQESTGYDAVADANGFLVVYPDGTGARRFGTAFYSWNAGYCCGEAARDGVDDVAFLRQLVDRLSERHDIDRARIFVTGHSNGGAMAHRLAVDAPDLVAAIVPVGSPGPDPDWGAASPTAVRLVHGTADRCASWDGGDTCGGCWSRAMEAVYGTDAGAVGDTFPCLSLDDQLAYWQGANGCDPLVATEVLRVGDAVCTRWEACSSGEPVERCVIEGGGHAWPGGTPGCASGGALCDAIDAQIGPWTDDVDGAALGWGFFGGR